jgi:serine/threonine-protein kinase HipA
MYSTIEIFLNGAWVPAAEFKPDRRRAYAGVFDYLPGYVFGGENPVPIALGLPVNSPRQGLDAVGEAPDCPAFLLDLVPQGRGRRYLEQIAPPGATLEVNDLLLIQFGAFNPIGNLRLDTAVTFYRERLALEAPSPRDGFTLDDIVRKQDDFLTHLWQHAMLSAGTTGVQGAAPKFLLTQNHDGLWFADAALPDDDAAAHWLIKLARGRQEDDRLVLRNEAAYAAVAQRCGLRVEHPAQMQGNMLFSRRFDRLIDADGQLHRLHQESLASLAGVRSFGRPISLFTLTAALRRCVTDRTQETIEFLKRDILNLALRNTDNHARNTAVQRLPDGTVRLTPLFDFAPMYLDPEFIVRGCKWLPDGGKECETWETIIQKITQDSGEAATIAGQLKAFQTDVEALPVTMSACGIDQRIIDDCSASIAAQVARLDSLPSLETRGRRG